MNRVIYKINLDFAAAVATAPIRCFTCEASSRSIEVSFRTGGKEYIIEEGTTAVFRVKTESGKYIYNNCEVADNKVIVDITSAAVSTAGECDCQITLSSPDGALLASPEFKMYCHEPVLSDSEIEGTDDFSALTEAIAEVKSIKEGLSKPKGLIFYGTTEEVCDTITVDTDTDGAPLSLNDTITIYLDTPASSDTGNVLVYLNSDVGAFIPGALQKSGAKSRCSLIFNGRTWENYSAVSTSYTSNATVTSIVKYEVDDVINEIKLGFSAGFPVGTKYYVYGRNTV